MKFLFSIALIALALLPDTISAQGIFAGICEGTTCSACHLAVLGNTLIDWLIGVIMVLFAVLAVVAGFGLVTAGGNPTAVTDAKSKFTNAIIGLLIVLSAWLIVDTLMRALIGNNGVIQGYGPWAQIQCTTQSESEVKPGNLGTFDPVELEVNIATVSPGSDGACPIGYLMDASGSCEFLSGPVLPSVGGRCPVGYIFDAFGDCELSAISVIPPTPGGGGPNCAVNESSMVSIPGESTHRAVASVASAYVNMRRVGSGRGINLSLTSSYRSDARQTQLWDGCPRCQSAGTVARPCSRGGNGSRHSSGVALDIRSSGGRAERCEVANLCRSAGASFIMFYSSSDHVHCDWGATRGEVNVSC